MAETEFNQSNKVPSRSSFSKAGTRNLVGSQDTLKQLQSLADKLDYQAKENQNKYLQQKEELDSQKNSIKKINDLIAFGWVVIILTALTAGIALISLTLQFFAFVLPNNERGSDTVNPIILNIDTSSSQQDDEGQ